MSVPGMVKKAGWYALVGYSAFFWLMLALDVMYWYFY